LYSECLKLLKKGGTKSTSWRNLYDSIELEEVTLNLLKALRKGLTGPPKECLEGRWDSHKESRGDPEP
jgi:hypothetical protein